MLYANKALYHGHSKRKARDPNALSCSRQSKARRNGPTARWLADGSSKDQFVRGNEMAFKRLWNHTPGKLSDEELEHLMPLVRRDPAIIKTWNRLMTEGLAYDRDHPNWQDMHGDVMVEIKRLSISVFPHADPYDWFEIERQLESGGVDANSNRT